jgi:hypothetical protein
MVKGKFVLLSILAAALLCWQFLPMNTNTASSGIVDPCSSEAAFCGSGERCFMVCPQGDGDLLSDKGNEICVTIRNSDGDPIENILATDFWLVGCTDLVLCGGSGSSNADAATAADGTTQFSGAMAAGGCDNDGLMVVCQGVVIGCPPTCLVMEIHSPDISGDLLVDLVDFGLFGIAFATALGDPGYEICFDFDCDGDIDLVDFAIFAQHWQHLC